MVKKPLWVIIAGSALLVAASVTYYLTVLKPQQDAEALAKANLAACQDFKAAIEQAAQESELQPAYEDLFRGAKKALAHYESLDGAKALGDQISQLKTFAEIEGALDALGDTAYATISKQMVGLSETCSAVLSE